MTASGHASKADGVGVTFKITNPAGSLGKDANVAYTKLVIPKQLPSELRTIQQACRNTTFETNPASCPEHSVIGHAVIHTQVLPVPLEGPVYFVSYGNAKFPDVVMVLQGDNVNINLTGETLIHQGVTSVTFKNTPDVPFENVEVTVPAGPYSEFGSNLPKNSYDFCGQKLAVPDEFHAANGAETHQQTTVTITNCPKTKTRAQLLAAALQACHKQHNQHKRKTCETTARKKYAAKTSRTHKHPHPNQHTTNHRTTNAHPATTLTITLTTLTGPLPTLLTNT